MSSAFYPQGMVGYNNRLRQGGYKTWKGTGFFSNPIGITWGNIRPYTNRDLTNNVVYKTGQTRPLKQYRKGISVFQTLPGKYQENREVKSSTRGNLVAQLMDMPGCVNILQNKVGEKNNIEKTNHLCETFRGVATVSNIYPNVNYCQKPPVVMQNGDQPIIVTPGDVPFCCNQQKNALRLVRSSTNLKQNYYTTTYQYLQNRCQTFEQKSFNFVVPCDYLSELCKPGDPLSIDNFYVANCLPNSIIKESVELNIIDYISNFLIGYDPTFSTIILHLKTLDYNDFLKELHVELDKREDSKMLLAFVAKVISANQNYQNLAGPGKHCGKVIYKPSNSQFATQGAVSASNYILKKDVVALETYDYNTYKTEPYQSLNCNNCGTQNVSNLYKTKGSTCLKNGVCNSITNIKTYGNRRSKYAYMVPELIDPIYTPKLSQITAR